ncbi:hypothetical protein LCGC14_3114810 [marine sediment metagenome]|uniref:Uncharacterized protein n=1 Tax=marine sediment metagenome TaxID=412755 RepID=A0A0F8W414_9ZZZZ
MKCLRCETVGRKPGEGIHKVIGPNGDTENSFVCNKCLEEIDYCTYAPEYENQEE